MRATVRTKRKYNLNNVIFLKVSHHGLNTIINTSLIKNKFSLINIKNKYIIL